MIPVNLPLVDGREKELLIECIESGWISEGPYVKKFEENFSNFIGMNHGIAVTNGTAALEAAIFAIDLKEGDEVIMPSFTIISCAIAALRFGAKPVLVDIEPLTWNINVDQIESKITSRTKAIMAIHMYGHPCDIDPILDLAKKYNLQVIEDASQVAGALYKEKKCGGIGHISAFSLYANKIVTTGEGGMVMTSDDKMADRARSYRNLCFRPDRRFYHTELGNNLRMTNMQGAIGIAQLERIDEFVEIKRANGVRYRELLHQIPGIRGQIEKPWAKMVYWMYAVELDESTGWDAEKMMAELFSRGVETRPFFIGLHEQPALLDKGLYENEQFPVTYKSSRQGFYLPSSMNLTNTQINFVVDQIKDILEV